MQQMLACQIPVAYHLLFELQLLFPDRSTYVDPVPFKAVFVYA